VTQQAHGPAALQPATQAPDPLSSLTVLHADVRSQRKRMSQAQNVSAQQLAVEVSDTVLSLIDDNVYLQVTLFDYLINNVVQDIDRRLSDVESVCDDIENEGMSEELRLLLVKHLSEGEAVALKALEGPEVADEQKQAIEAWQQQNMALLTELTADDDDDDDEEEPAEGAEPAGNGAAAATTASA